MIYVPGSISVEDDQDPHEVHSCACIDSKFIITKELHVKTENMLGPFVYCKPLEVKTRFRISENLLVFDENFGNHMQSIKYGFNSI